jgi:hypothetical protein
VSDGDVLESGGAPGVAGGAALNEPRRRPRPPRPAAEVHGKEEVGVTGGAEINSVRSAGKRGRARGAKKTRPFERLTINLPDGPVLGAVRREAENGHLSLSQAGFKALERGVRRAPADAEDRLLKLERSLRDHMRLTARDFALTQELMVGVARALFERLPASEQTDITQRLAARDVEQLLARVVAEIANGRARGPHQGVESADTTG